MITFFWSFIMSLGFALSGFLLRDGEFRLAGIVFLVTWGWLLFPKIPKWSIQQIAKLFSSRRKATA